MVAGREGDHPKYGVGSLEDRAVGHRELHGMSRGCERDPEAREHTGTLIGSVFDALACSLLPPPNPPFAESTITVVDEHGLHAHVQEQVVVRTLLRTVDMRLVRKLLGVALLGLGVVYLRGRRKALAMGGGSG